MSTVEEIMQAIKLLSPEEQAKLRALYEKFDAALWDAQIEEDSTNGKLDKLVKESEEDFQAGRFREL